MGDVGTIRKLQIAGLPYRVFFDADLSETPTNYENSTLATSGPNVIKQEKRTRDVADVVIFADKNDKKTLKKVQDDGIPVPLGYTESDGTAWKATGTINIDTRTTMEGRMTLSLLPVGDWV